LNLGLKITGTLGILVKAAKLGHIKNIDSIFQDLQSKGIWISESVLRLIKIELNKN